MNFNAPYVGRSGVGSQEFEGQNILVDVHYEHIEKAYIIIFLDRSSVSYQTLHSACERLFMSHSYGKNVCNFAQFCRSSWDNGFSMGTKDETHAHQVCSAALAIFIY